jgi:3-deoxy-7-phosphoheptulonate synthase
VLIMMRKDAPQEQIDRLVQKITEHGYTAHVLPGAVRVAIAVTGNDRAVRIESLEALDGVLEVIHVTRPYKLVGREWKPEPTTIRVGDVTIGGDEIVVIAGPCTVESREQVLAIADLVKRDGAHLLRGGAWKPRTSPYSFQGLKEEGLRYLAEARERTGLKIVTEVMAPENVPLVAEYADILQVGARNMQNFSLLEEVGKARKPVLLKRGMSATIKELLLAAEYILQEGNYQVILCERGIRTFEDALRNTFDISAIPLVKQASHLPIFADPSHATGDRSKVAPLARAAVAAGADGLMIEVHNRPEEALCDGPQSLLPEHFSRLIADLERVAAAVGRRLHARPGAAPQAPPRPPGASGGP